MLLQAALGFSLMATKGLTSETHAALIRAVELAESLDDLDYQLRTLFCLCLFRLRNADFRSALGLARQCEAVADRITDPRASESDLDRRSADARTSCLAGRSDLVKEHGLTMGRGSNERRAIDGRSS
jgi:hypothetical protein